MGTAWRRFRSWPVWLQAAIGVFLGLIVIGGIFGEEPKETVSTTETTTTTTSSIDLVTTPSAVTASTTTTSTTRTSTSSPSTTTSRVASTTTTTKGAPSTTVAASPLRGIGQTRAEWDRTHRKAPGFVDGSAYLPYVGPNQAKYGGVFGDERILSYEVYMEPGTSLATAETTLRAELPPDAVAGRRTDGGDCWLQYWTSATLAQRTRNQKVAVAYSKDDLTIPREHRYVVATLILVEQDDDSTC